MFERVYVETPVDTDRDGQLDLVAVFIRRPVSTLEGEKVPAVYVANPYLMTCNEDWYLTHDVDKEVKVYPQQNLPEQPAKKDLNSYVSPQVKHRETAGFAETSLFDEESVEFECISEINAHFNERGYASVFCGGLGTRYSQGVNMTGCQEEILVFRSVIDWLNGRCRAFTNLTDNIEIRADWCTGNVAMSGKSYLGTMCIGVAATGVEGLKTIIPEAGISNWYDYYRCNGLNLPALGWQGDDLDILAKYCFSRAKDPEDYESVRPVFEENQQRLLEAEDRESGNYNTFWDMGNYLKRVDQMKASVFLIHGLNDWNVKMNQCIPLFQALEKQGIPRKMLLHQGEHVFIYRLRNARTVEYLDRWLDYYLKGEDTGILDEPTVLVESNLDQLQWSASDTWPPAGGQCKNFPIETASLSKTLTITDDLSKTVFRKEEDNLSAWRDELVLSEDEDYRNRLRFLWDPFSSVEDREELRLSGTFRISFRASLNRPTAILSAMLVDLGEDRRVTAEQEEAEDGSFLFGLEQNPSPYKVITRGWMNAQNRTSNWSKEELKQGCFYDYAFDMIPTDYRLRRGHKLALLIYGTDAEATQRSPIVTDITVETASLKAELYLL
jgi:X-Pro dipeptidyl-peptidase